VRVTPSGGSNGDQHYKAEIHCRSVTFFTHLKVEVC
jgi:hypothetical protein